MEFSPSGIKRKAEEEYNVTRNVRPSRTTAIGSGFPETQLPGTSSALKGESSAAISVSQYGSVFSSTITAQENARVFQGNVVNNNYASCEHETGLRDWLNKLNFDHMNIRRRNLKPTLGTCQWLFETEEFRTWDSPSGARNDAMPILVLKGKPGSGKSVLLNAAMQRSESPSKDATKDAVTLGFFFSNASGVWLGNTMEGLYRSLVLQLLQQLKRLSPQTEIDTILAQYQLPAGDSWDVGILEELLMVLLESLGGKSVYFFLDALDECFGYQQDVSPDNREVLKLLDRISTSGLPTHIFFTIRNEANLENFLDSFRVVDIKENNQSDIETFVNTTVNRIRSIPPDIRMKLPAIIIRRSSNMFLWARLVMEELKKVNRRWPEKEILNVIESLPTELHDLYRMLVQSLPPSRLQKALTLLQVLQVAYRPLTVTEIKSALCHVPSASNAKEISPEAFDKLSMEDFDDELYELSGGLVEVTPSLHPEINGLAMGCMSQPIVQFIHKSVTDFLHDGGLRTLDPKLNLSTEAHSHLCIATICMRLLDTPEAATLAASEEEAEIATSFLPYASQFWTLHARRSDDIMPPDFKPPTNLLFCQIETLVRLFRKFTRGRFFAKVADVPNQILLRCDFNGTKCSLSDNIQYCQDSLLVLLALEGCAKLFEYHARECKHHEKCHSNRHILERAFLCAVHRGWVRTTTSVWNLAEDRKIPLDVNMHLPSERPFTALYIACFKGHTNIVEFLLRAGADALKGSAMPYVLPLHAACAQGYLEAVRLLLRHADSKIKGMLFSTIRWKSERGWSVLHLAANFGRRDIIEEILDHCRMLGLGSIVRAKTERRLTAIEIAQRSMHDARQSLIASKDDFQQIVHKLEEFSRGMPQDS